MQTTTKTKTTMKIIEKKLEKFFYRDEQEKQPLSSNGYKKNSVVDMDGRTQLGETIGKSSLV